MPPSDYKAIRCAVLAAFAMITARKEIAVTQDEFRHWEKRAKEANAAIAILEKYKPEE